MTSLPSHSAYSAPTRTNILAVVSLVFSIIGVFACGTTLPLGIALGHLARRQIAQTGERGRRLATTAVIVGYVFAFIYIFGELGWLMGLIGPRR
jgi:hypothetical protein